MEVKQRTAKSLVSRLGSVSDNTRADALRELRLSTKHDPDIRPILAECGAVPYLSETLYSNSHDLQENAAASLLNLSISSKHDLLSSPGLLDSVSHVLRHHSSSSSPAAVQSCSALLHSLLIVDTLRPIIGSKRDIVYSLIDILKSHNAPPRSVKDALKALFGISLYPLNRATAIQLGIAPVLFNLTVREGRVGILEDTTAVIAQVAGCEEASEEFAKVSGVRLLVDLIDIGTGLSMRIKENAVSGLLNLARCGGETVVEEIRKWCLAESGFGVLEGISEVTENGTEKGKGKAAELLKIVDSEFPRIVGSGSESECGSSSGVDLSENHRFVYLTFDSS
ncbi:hypothetical protein MLD38_024079 [Melastoma candidum]|uniref:Uncharacterized protein n=1 Tax=Melastoma candidum TaxID=119954 RepID=A0ACB9NR93_9MYRT|nr:hypothetical protein MLD38_024079 [Melastoma candidum]